jgi:methylase of polypeptide subunit release factors
MGKSHSGDRDSDDDYRYKFARRFFTEAADYLKPQGYIQMIYPSFASPEVVIRIANEAGWKNEILASTKGLSGTYYIYKFERR